MNTPHTLLDEQAKIFKALGHPTRLLMVETLQQGERCVCDLQTVVGDDLSTVSRHLSVLREAGVVSSRKEGTNIYYSLELRCLGNFLKCTRAHLAARLAARLQILA